MDFPLFDRENGGGKGGGGEGTHPLEIGREDQVFRITFFFFLESRYRFNAIGFDVKRITFGA